MTGFDVTLGCQLAESHECQDLFRNAIPDPSNCPAGATVNKSMKHLRVDTRHQHDIIVSAGNVLARITQRGCASELFEADQIRKLRSQVEEKVGFGFEAIVGTVVDDGRKFWRCRKNSREMIALRGGGCAT